MTDPTPPLPTLPDRLQTSSRVVEALSDRILSGGWEPGQKLPSEAELGRQLKASRTAIREAMRHLRGTGMIETVNGSGSYVSSAGLGPVRQALSVYAALASGRDSAQELLALRAAIEGESAASLARAADADRLQPLRDRMTQMRQATDVETFAQLDIEFHMDLLKASDNSLFAELGKAMRDRYVRFATASYRHQTQNRDVTLPEHDQILAAIESGDPNQARDAIHHHIRQARDRWSASPGSSPGSSLESSPESSLHATGAVT